MRDPYHTQNFGSRIGHAADRGSVSRETGPELGAIVATERKSGAWAAGLKADAIRKRQSHAKTPKL